MYSLAMVCRTNGWAKGIRPIAVWLIAAVLAAARPDSLSAAAGPTLVILFSGSGNGILRSCYCPNNPWGGLAQRAWLIDEVRKAAGPENVLLLDSGDFFPPEPDPPKLSCILRAYVLMRYDAVAIGEQELAGGLEAWRQLNESLVRPDHPAPRFPWLWLSGGYRLTAGPQKRQLLARPWMVREVAGHRVGIVSVVSPEAWRFSTNRLDGFKLTDPLRMVNLFVKEFSRNAELVIVLSHQGADADRELAKSLSGVDIIIGGHSQSLLDPPEIVNGIVICQAGKNGENVGMLVLAPRRPSPDGAPHTGAATAQDHAVENRIAPAERAPFSETLVETPRWRVAHRLIPLNTAVDESPEAAHLVDEYYAGLDRENARRLSRPAPEGGGGPRLVVENPVQETVIRPGEKQRFFVRLRNAGDAPLAIAKVRSKSRWLEVAAFPRALAPGADGDALMELTATNMNRFFRCEYTITSSDKHRVVCWGSINGHVEGTLPGILDVSSLLSAMVAMVRPAEAAGAETAALPESPVSVLPPVQRTDAVTEETEETGEAESGTAPPSRRVLVEFFFSEGCAECREIEEEVLPEFTNRFAGMIDLRAYDIGNPTNYLRLAGLEEKLNVRTDEPVSMFLDGRICLGGLREIRERLIPSVLELAAANAPAPAAVEPAAEAPEDSGILVRRLHAFTVPAIIAGGLADGVNPCAFATIVFLVTLLSVSGRRERDLLGMGTVYCVAVFVTYFLLGLGAFHLLQGLQAYGTASEWLRRGMIGVLIVLSALSFRDAWKFRRSGRPQDVTLQLPEGIKRRMHAIVRVRMSSGGLMAGALIAGFLVTLLESVCTGQVYLPTLVFLTRHPDLHGRAWALLALYNVMFVVPLVIVFVAAYRGVRSQRLVEWSKRNVVWGKSLMGLFFLALALVMLRG